MFRLGFIGVSVLVLLLWGSQCVLGSLCTNALVSLRENAALMGATYDVLQDRPDLLDEIDIRFQDIAEWGDTEVKTITSAAEQELILYGDLKRLVEITELHQELTGRLSDAINDVVKDPSTRERIQAEVTSIRLGRHET